MEGHSDSGQDRGPSPCSPPPYIFVVPFQPIHTLCKLPPGVTYPANLGVRRSGWRDCPGGDFYSPPWSFLQPLPQFGVYSLSRHFADPSTLLSSLARPHYKRIICALHTGKNGDTVFTFIFFKILFIFFREGKGRRKRERNINVWLPLTCPLPRIWPPTQARALTGNGTSDSLVHRLALSPLSHTN